MRKLAVAGSLALLGIHLLDQALRVARELHQHEHHHDHLPTVRKYHDEARPK